MERLVHAREFGDNQPFERASQTGLMKRLNTAEEDHWDADDYSQHEIRAHKVNLGRANVGDVDLQGRLLTIDFPRADGMWISEFIRVAPGSIAEPPEGYPVVEAQENRIRVQAKIDSIPRHSTVAAFLEPLRVWLREPARGRTLPVDYMLHAENLRSPGRLSTRRSHWPSMFRRRRSLIRSFTTV